MPDIDIPHFDLPFRLNGKSFGVVEQDTPADIANCVECIIRTPAGFREDSPDFGLEDLVFTNQPINTDRLTSQIVQQEPRAQVFITQQPDIYDALIEYLIVNVG